MILRVLPLYSKVRGRPQEVQASIILESHIICCTLSTSGGFLLESAFRRQGHDPFSCVIVDEVSKAISNYNQFIIDGNSCSTVFGRMGKYPLSANDFCRSLSSAHCFAASGDRLSFSVPEPDSDPKTISLSA